MKCKKWKISLFGIILSQLVMGPASAAISMPERMQQIVRWMKSGGKSKALVQNSLIVEQRKIESRKKAKQAKKMNDSELPRVDLGPIEDIYALDEDYLAPSLIEKIYDPELSKTLYDRAETDIYRREDEIFAPIRNTQQWEIQKLEQDKKSLAVNWARKRVADEQVKKIIQGADADSAPIKFLRAIKGLFGGSKFFDSVGKKKEKKIVKRKRRNKVAINKQNYLIAHRKKNQDPTLYNPKTEEERRTRLRGKLNLARQYGHLRFENPVMDAQFELHMKTDDRMQINIGRDIEAISLRSNANYGFTRKTYNFDITKKITNQIQAAVSANRFVNHLGERKTERRASVRYHFSF